MMGTREELIRSLADVVASVVTAHPTRVAVDGRPAAGKTTLADELAAVLRARGRHVVRASIDSFLFSRQQRYRNGKYSAEANYRDSFDFDALHRVLLDPLGPGGDRRIRTAIRDRDTDTALSLPVRTASADAVLLFDGVFLMRPELISSWDLRILVSTGFAETLARSRVRDRAVHGSEAETERLFHHRYGPSQDRYLAEVRPADIADVVVHNDEPGRPAWDVRPR